MRVCPTAKVGRLTLTEVLNPHDAGAPAVRSSVLIPVKTSAKSALEQPKPNLTSVGQNAAVGVSEILKPCFPPGRMLTGVFGDPIGWPVAGSVAWNENWRARP